MKCSWIWAAFIWGIAYAERITKRWFAWLYKRSKFAVSFNFTDPTNLECPLAKFSHFLEPNSESALAGWKTFEEDELGKPQVKMDKIGTACPVESN